MPAVCPFFTQTLTWEQTSTPKFRAFRGHEVGAERCLFSGKADLAIGERATITRRKRNLPSRLLSRGDLVATLRSMAASPAAAFVNKPYFQSVDGAPEEIQNPDPQIRSLGAPAQAGRLELIERVVTLHVTYC